MKIGNRLRLRAYVIAIVIILCIYSYSTAINAFAVMKQKNPELYNVTSHNISFLYSFYVQGRPSDSEICLGNTSAKIKMIAYLDIASNKSTQFINNIYPLLQRDFISNSGLKFCYKNYVTIDDANQNSLNYQFAIASYCVRILKPESYYDFVFYAIRQNNKTDTEKAVLDNGIPLDSFNQCIHNSDRRFVMQEIIENENLANGIRQRFYIGITGTSYSLVEGLPPYTSFSRTLKNYQMMIGE